MKRNILLTLTVVVFLLFGSGCDSGCDSDVVTVNMSSNDNEIVNKEVGTDALVFIGGKLYYDPLTKIVYFWNGHDDTNLATMPSPYYAPNGLPYKYDVETNGFEEIKVVE